MARRLLSLAGGSGSLCRFARPSLDPLQASSWPAGAGAGATNTHNFADKGLYYDWGPRIGPWTFYCDSGQIERRCPAAGDGQSWNQDGTEIKR